MSAAAEPVSVKRQQRRVLLVGLVVAAIPILCQILMLCAVATAPAAFPAADRTLAQARFWPVQIVLLCVAIAGSAIVDFVRLLLAGGTVEKTAVGFFLLVLLFFFVVSVMFSVTLLASQIGWLWLISMTIAGAAAMVFAYYLEMEIAGSP
jgi:hypothetical protein